MVLSTGYFLYIATTLGRSVGVRPHLNRVKASGAKKILSLQAQQLNILERNLKQQKLTKFVIGNELEDPTLKTHELRKGYRCETNSLA